MGRPVVPEVEERWQTSSGLASEEEPLHRVRVLPPVLPPPLQDLGEGEEPGVLVAPHPLLVLVDHIAHVGDLAPDLVELVHLLLVLGEDHARPRVLEHVGDLGGKAALVDPHADPPHRLGPELGVEPLGNVVGDDGKPLPRPKAQGEEAVGEEEDVLVVLGVGDLVPDAVVLLPEGHPVPLVLRPEPEELGQGVALHLVGGPQGLHTSTPM